jgi:hypothetical protein
MPPPIPRCSSWAYSSLISPSHFSLPRYGSRVGLHIVLFEACLAFTRVAACALALSPIRDTLIEGFSHFVTSMTAPIASGWSGCRVGLAPTGKRRLCTAHANSGRSGSRSRRLRTGCQSGRGGALTANRAAEPVGHTDLLYRLAGVKLPTPGPVFSLQALTHLRHCAFLVLFVRRVRSRRM